MSESQNYHITVAHTRRCAEHRRGAMWLKRSTKSTERSRGALGFKRRARDGLVRRHCSGCSSLPYCHCRPSHVGVKCSKATLLYMLNLLLINYTICLIAFNRCFQMRKHSNIFHSFLFHHQLLIL
jgi:hypothetical protein